MLTITKIEFFPNVIREYVIVRTIDVGEQMVTVGEVDFD
jgi:hypothetical protein